ncbi:DUF5916 domain-containing protein [Nonlabens xiamenensis]|uniref:DUF5916 domain-containing protein n=1 Tax=Nonlabens xiamenensis TaxID=2341043 RepID=UPI001F0C651B|nr:DUF5916 domain-containing protein [Nonlabens xiamenensis]
MKSFYFLFFLFAFAKAATAQTPTKSNEISSDSLNISRKSYVATRVNDKPNIDGKPFEAFWEGLPVAKDFVMIEPTNGQAERPTHRTEVKIAYDDTALYVAGYLYDDDPGSIPTQFSQRDQIGVQADNFGFYINTYNNQINQTRFFATSANALADAIVEGGREDFSYNVVFTSETSIDDKGWYVEMKIPYRTLRFPKRNVQDWSFQVTRRIVKLNEFYSYNYIDITKGNDTQYDALLKGVAEINPPLRLNLYPYTSVVHNRFAGENTTDYSAGLDLKYGINEAFTLDATLIPDFGQVAFDQVRLNLGPFEQTFGENRAFFNEGTDLLNKGGIFFSRRIGQTPSGFSNIELFENEDIIDNPSSAQLLNAVKVTGRTKNRLGVGVLNAITEKTEATVENSADGFRRLVVTEPFTNYNMFVLDQQFGKNSSASIANANTLRNGSFTDANVTALIVDLNDSQAANNYHTEVKMSNRFTPTGTDSGYQTEIQWRRTTGKWRPRLGHFLTGENWNPNDLGQNFSTNFQTFAADLQYNQFTQQGIFNRYNIELRMRHERQLNPDIITKTDVTLNPFFITRERLAFGMDVVYSTRNLNQFESRIPRQVVRYNPATFVGGFISTDYRKKLALDINAGYFQRFDDPELSYDYNVSPRFRFSDKFLLIYRYSWSRTDDRISYVTRINEGATAILSNRNTHTVENQISGTYNFNNRQALSIAFRNFWSRASFSRNFEELQDDGTTIPSDYALEDGQNPDANFNIWNLDLSYRWRFAPGSEATLLYRNSIFNQDDQGEISYQDSLQNLFQQDQRHNISLRVTYFLDFNDARRLFKA